MKKTTALQTIVLLVAISSSLSAQAFTDLFVFGDSLSDTGNVQVFSEGEIPPSTVYFEGRFSNGPVWIEYLATGLGLPTPEASQRGGNNFAYGGAQTGNGGSTIFHSVPNVGSQILAFMELGKTIDDTDLVVVWAGHNDLFGGLSPAAAATNLGSPHFCTSR